MLLEQLRCAEFGREYGVGDTAAATGPTGMLRSSAAFGYACQRAFSSLRLLDKLQSETLLKEIAYCSACGMPPRLDALGAACAALRSTGSGIRACGRLPAHLHAPEE